MIRGRLLRGSAAIALTGAGALGFWALSAAGAASPVTLLASETPGTHATTVPTGICFVTITADGGHGGDGLHGLPRAEAEGDDGGGVAASVAAPLPLTPRATTPPP